MEKDHRDRHVKEAVEKAIKSLEKDVDRRTEMCASLVEKAVANERERCAEICEELAEEADADADWCKLEHKRGRGDMWWFRSEKNKGIAGSHRKASKQIRGKEQ